jgi:hypothetical protein
VTAAEHRPRTACGVRIATTAAACSLALLLAGGAGDGPRFGTVATLAAPKGQTIRSAVLRDVDGDGREDLVLATRRVTRRGDSRHLRVHLRREGDPAFAADPDATWELDEAVTAFAAGDVDAAPGAEIVLFTAAAVYAWKPRAPEGQQFVRLLEASFLFQLPDAKEAFPFEGAVSDVDGDGLDDLVIPEPEGYRIALQRRGKDGTRFDPPSVLVVPEEAAESEAGDTLASRRLRARAARRQLKIALQVGGGDGRPSGDLLSIEERIPSGHLADFDGDGRKDVLAQTGKQLHVWRQGPDGRFAAQPDLSLDLPVPADRKRRLDVSYSAQTADLDGDRRTDCVLFAGDKNSDDVRTQVLVFTQAKNAEGAPPLFPADGLPRQLLVIAGFAGTPRLVDVDGDGRKDLTAGSMRLDALDAVSAAAKGTLDAELYVYRNQGGSFSRTPDLSFPLSIRAEGLRRGRESLIARFVGDVTGDGVRDLLLRDEPGRLRLHMIRRSGEGLTVVPQPLSEIHIQDNAKVRIRDREGAAPEVLVVEDGQVRHVRWP